jgi:hypothetical protein
LEGASLDSTRLFFNFERSVRRLDTAVLLPAASTASAVLGVFH